MLFRRKRDGNERPNMNDKFKKLIDMATNLAAEHNASLRAELNVPKFDLKKYTGKVQAEGSIFYDYERCFLFFISRLHVLNLIVMSTVQPVNLWM